MLQASSRKGVRVCDFVSLPRSTVVSLLIVITSGPSIEARQAGVPAAPALGAALVSPAAGGAIVGISWAFPAGSTATNIQIQAGSGPGLSDIAVASIAANPTAFSTFAPPGTYYVRLVAINAAGASAPSNEIIIFVGGDGGCQPPGIPTGLTATPGAGNVTLRWNPSAIGGAATGYSLLAGSFSGGVNLGTFPVGLLDHRHRTGSSGPILRSRRRQQRLRQLGAEAARRPS